MPDQDAECSGLRLMLMSSLLLNSAGHGQLVTGPGTDDSDEENSVDRRTVQYLVQYSVLMQPAAAEALRRQRALQLVVPPVYIGLEDVDAGYRRVPCCQPGHTVVAFWNPEVHSKGAKGETQLVQVWGFSFELLSAVVAFCRLPAFSCWVSSLLFAVPVTHHIDDFIFVDTAASDGSAQLILAELHKHLRICPFLAKNTLLASPQTVFWAYIATCRELVQKLLV